MSLLCIVQTFLLPNTIFLSQKSHFYWKNFYKVFFSPSRDSMMPYDITVQKFPNPLKQEVTTHENEMNHSLPAL